MDMIKRILKKIFLPEKISYKMDILFLIVSLSFSLILIILFLIYEINFIAPVVAFLIIILFIVFIRMIFISDNKKKNDMERGKYKKKYDPIKIDLEEFLIICQKEEIGFTFEIKIDYRYTILGVGYDDYINIKKNGSKYYFFDYIDYEDFNSFENNLREIFKDKEIFCYMIDDNNPNFVWNNLKERYKIKV